MEMIVRKPRAKNLSIPPEIDGIKRVEAIRVLGVFIQDNLSFGEQVDHLVAQGAQTLHALRILKHNGLNGPHLWTVANSTLLARLTYASPAWWGLIGSEGLLRLQSVLSRAVKQGFLPPNQPAFDKICDKNYLGLFNAMTTITSFTISFSSQTRGIQSASEEPQPCNSRHTLSENIYQPHDFP